MQVWSPRDTYVNHHEVTNLLVDLPEDGPMRDSIFAIMRVRRRPSLVIPKIHSSAQLTQTYSLGWALQCDVTFTSVPHVSKSVREQDAVSRAAVQDDRSLLRA